MTGNELLKFLKSLPKDDLNKSVEYWNFIYAEWDSLEVDRATNGRSSIVLSSPLTKLEDFIK